MAKTLDEMAYVGSIRDFIIRMQKPDVEAETVYGVLVISAPDRNTLIDVLSAFTREPEFKGNFGIYLVGNTKAVVWSLEVE